jgi:hypothetical protein
MAGADPFDTNSCHEAEAATTFLARLASFGMKEISLLLSAPRRRGRVVPDVHGVAVNQTGVDGQARHAVSDTWRRAPVIRRMPTA